MFNPTQKSKNHGLTTLNLVPSHSNRELGVEIRVYEPNHRGSEILFMDFERFLGSFLDSNLCFDETLTDSQVYNGGFTL